MSQDDCAYQFVDLPYFAALDPRVAVAGQLAPEHMALIRSAGFASVINNRPDGEGGPHQPSSAQMQQAAASAGLHYVHQPVVSTHMTSEDVQRFHEHLALLPKPVLAFCRSGARCMRLFQG